MHVTWRPTLTTLSNCHISSPQQPHRRFSTFSQHAASALPPASNFNDSDDRTDDEVGAHGSSGDDWLQDSDIKRWQPGSVAGGPAAASDGIAEPLAPGLYLVSTPIGNLEDITLRALRVLRSANLVLCEDTRHSGKLLRAYGIRNHTMSYHAHNEKGREAYLLQRLKDGEVSRAAGFCRLLRPHAIAASVSGCMQLCCACMMPGRSCSIGKPNTATAMGCDARCLIAPALLCPPCNTWYWAVRY